MLASKGSGALIAGLSAMDTPSMRDASGPSGSTPQTSDVCRQTMTDELLAVKTQVDSM
jgi:hypothetical protein